MINFKTILTIFLIIIYPLLGFSQMTNLDNIYEIREGIKTKRVSSYDTIGGNRDWKSLPSHSSLELFNVKGTGIIKHIWFTLDPKENRNNIILKIYWDGSDIPSVNSPIGYFFGQGWNENYTISSLPLVSAPKDGNALICFFQMPFSKGARIVLENQGEIEFKKVYYYIDYDEVDELTNNTGRFHAWYNHEYTVVTKNDLRDDWWNDPVPANKSGEDNYIVLDIKGKGEFVGLNFYVQSPVPVWWGEGDEMIFIDGDKNPTLHGTGSEDCFNFAWGLPDEFTHSYFGVKRISDQNFFIGKTHAYRFYIADPIHFDNSIKYTIEHGHNNNRQLNISTVAYWYQKGVNKELAEIPDMELREQKKDIMEYDVYEWYKQWRKSNSETPENWGNER